MIAVTGASGKLGHWVIQHLLKKVPASQIVAIVRNPAKAEDLKKLGVSVRKGDYDQADSWSQALEGISRLLLISSSEVGKRHTQHETVIQAAKKAQVRHIAYTSILKADVSSLILAKEHLATEQSLRQSGIPFTLLRNGWYLENHTENLAPALEYGAIHGAAKDGKFSSASRSDFAQAAATVLTSEGHENKVYELAGDTSFTLSELADAVSKKANKSVSYQDHSFEDFKKILMQVGLPEGFAAILADSDVGASKGELHSDSKDLSKLINRPTTPLAEALQAAIK
ncbi:MAG: SDR family oxidoreductase [Bdellovibrionaceae bacterium]|nr:SDR family oxidoreductase [Pseudobdellovibrionaceae bacterium]